LAAGILVLLSALAGTATAAEADEAPQVPRFAYELVTVLVAFERIEYDRDTAGIVTYSDIVRNVRVRQRGEQEATPAGLGRLRESSAPAWRCPACLLWTGREQGGRMHPSG
jgi:hypothetical protein